ncbi:DUF1178 family protein [Halovulum sp. GXIMD14793]
MIKYQMKCEEGHDFDSWFGSIKDFERLKKAGLISCAVCGSTHVDRALMAPRLGTERDEKPLSAPASPAEQAIQELRKKVEASSEDIGRSFAAEARRIHEGDAPERAIRGEATMKEAKSLAEDGVPVVPLPWSDRGKT